MHAKSVDELQVYQKALVAADAVSAILKRPCFTRDPRLRDQMGSSSERVASSISEGFGQSTDRHFAVYLHGSRASSNEIRTQLRIAFGRDYISSQELDELREQYDEIARMTTGLLRHLRKEDRKERG
jgi:four helix bundle protein